MPGKILYSLFEFQQPILDEDLSARKQIIFASWSHPHHASYGTEKNMSALRALLWYKRYKRWPGNNKASSVDFCSHSCKCAEYFCNSKNFEKPQRILKRLSTPKIHNWNWIDGNNWWVTELIVSGGKSVFFLDWRNSHLCTVVSSWTQFSQTFNCLKFRSSTRTQVRLLISVPTMMK